MSELTITEKKEVETIFEAVEVSSNEPSMSEWSSLRLLQRVESINVKKTLYDKVEHSDSSLAICNKYVPHSDSTVLRHSYYNYPGVLDPGIQEALLLPEETTVFADDGQDLYLHLCSEMNICPVHLFHKNLLNSEINLSYYGVDPKGIRPMAMALESNENVRIFNLTDNFLTDDGCYHLGMMLKSNKTLEELNLTGCRIGLSGIMHLGDHLLNNNKLMTLGLAKNKLGDSGGVHTAYLLSQGASILNLNLSYNELGKETAMAIAELYDFRDPLIKLDLSWNSFVHDPSTVKMLNYMSSSSVLQELNLSFNALSGKRVALAICNVLSIPTLKVLDLSHNRFQDEPISDIVAGLIKAKKLIILDLSFNPLTPNDAVTVLKEMLKPRVKLENLRLETICVNREFMAILARVSKMKSRKKFKIIYGDILHNWSEPKPDMRKVILKRAEYLGTVNKKHKLDILVYFLTLCQKSEAPLNLKSFMETLENDNVPLSEDYIKELSILFPGPKVKKFITLDIKAVCEYIHRLWPDKKAPVIIPPPVEVPIAAPTVVAPPPSKKEKGKNKK